MHHQQMYNFLDTNLEACQRMYNLKETDLTLYMLNFSEET